MKKNNGMDKEPKNMVTERWVTNGKVNYTIAVKGKSIKVSSANLRAMLEYGTQFGNAYIDKNNKLRVIRTITGVRKKTPRRIGCCDELKQADIDVILNLCGIEPTASAERPKKLWQFLELLTLYPELYAISVELLQFLTKKDVMTTIEGWINTQSVRYETGSYALYNTIKSLEMRKRTAFMCFDIINTSKEKDDIHLVLRMQVAWKKTPRIEMYLVFVRSNGVSGEIKFTKVCDDKDNRQGLEIVPYLSEQDVTSPLIDENGVLHVPAWAGGFAEDFAERQGAVVRLTGVEIGFDEIQGMFEISRPILKNNPLLKYFALTCDRTNHNFECVINGEAVSRGLFVNCPNLKDWTILGFPNPESIQVIGD